MNMKTLRRELLAAAEAGKTRGVYGLRDPRDGRIRYVGQSQHIERRFYDHLCRSQYEKALGKRAWVFGLYRVGLKPELVILAEIAAGDLNECERFWVGTLELIGDADFNWHHSNKVGVKPKWRKAAMNDTIGWGK
jgi:hypothetical protein